LLVCWMYSLLYCIIAL